MYIQYTIQYSTVYIERHINVCCRTSIRFGPSNELSARLPARLRSTNVTMSQLPGPRTNYAAESRDRVAREDAEFAKRLIAWDMNGVSNARLPAKIDPPADCWWPTEGQCKKKTFCQYLYRVLRSDMVDLKSPTEHHKDKNHADLIRLVVTALGDGSLRKYTSPFWHASKRLTKMRDWHAMGSGSGHPGSAKEGYSCIAIKIDIWQWYVDGCMPTGAIIDVSDQAAQRKFLQNHTLSDLGGDSYQSIATRAFGFAAKAAEVLIKWRGTVPHKYCSVIDIITGDDIATLDDVLADVVPTGGNLVKAIGVAHFGDANQKGVGAVVPERRNTSTRPQVQGDVLHQTRPTQQAVQVPKPPESRAALPSPPCRTCPVVDDVTPNATDKKSQGKASADASHPEPSEDKATLPRKDRCADSEVPPIAPSPGKPPSQTAWKKKQSTQNAQTQELHVADAVVASMEEYRTGKKMPPITSAIAPIAIAPNSPKGKVEAPVIRFDLCAFEVDYGGMEVDLEDPDLDCDVFHEQRAAELNARSQNRVPAVPLVRAQLEAPSSSGSQPSLTTAQSSIHQSLAQSNVQSEQKPLNLEQPKALVSLEEGYKIEANKKAQLQHMVPSVPPVCAQLEAPSSSSVGSQPRFAQSDVQSERKPLNPEQQQALVDWVTTQRTEKRRRKMSSDQCLFLEKVEKLEDKYRAAMKSINDQIHDQHFKLKQWYHANVSDAEAGSPGFDRQRQDGRRRMNLDLRSDKHFVVFRKQKQELLLEHGSSLVDLGVGLAELEMLPDSLTTLAVHAVYNKSHETGKRGRRVQGQSMKDISYMNILHEKGAITVRKCERTGIARVVNLASQYSTVQYSTVQYSTVQYSTVFMSPAILVTTVQ